tara:strand:- start:12419 stop:14686 length:2268 start_codon:yes stop_codon:yes gene_type:complete
MENLKNQANQVANAGRFGDSMLVHMNPIEVQGLASSMPMTINPQTGQPEMFLPFLAPLLGGAAGTALFSGIMSPAVAGAVGSGLATAIAEGDLKKGIMAGITGFGIGNVLGQIGAGTKGAADQATKEFIEAAAEQTGSAVATNPVITQALADQAAQAQVESAMAGFTGNVTNLGQAADILGQDLSGINQAIADNLTTKADVLAQASGKLDVGAGDRLGMIGKNLFSGDTLSALAQPASYVPIALGEGSRGVMEAQEQFEEDMRKFAQEEEERKRRLYEMNPEQIPFGSPFYGSAKEGGIVGMANGQQVPSFEEILKGQADVDFTPAIYPEVTQPVTPAQQIVMQNLETGEIQPTGQFIPASNYRPGIDPEFNYFPFSNRPASVLPGGFDGTNFVDNTFYDFLRNVQMSDNAGTTGDMSMYNYMSSPNTSQNTATTAPAYAYTTAPATETFTSSPTTDTNATIGTGTTGTTGTTSTTSTYTPPPDVTVDTMNQAAEGTGITSQAKQETFDALQNAYYANPYLSNPYLGTEEYKQAMAEDLLEASADFLEDLKGKKAIAMGGDRMASGRKIDDVTRGMAIHEMNDGKTIPEDAIGLQELAKEKPDVVRTMGYEVDMQTGGVTVMPEDLDMVQKAILGQIPNNTEVIAMFIDKYGNEIFMQIREQVLNPMGSMQTQGMIEGMGGGMDDQVMGMIGTQQPVAVSPGEYIIPADVVSGLGDGSSDAGAKELDGMLDRVRQERTNTTKQPKELNKGRVLPA